jgi:hypothetical protein
LHRSATRLFALIARRAEVGIREQQAWLKAEARLTDTGREAKFQFARVDRRLMEPLAVSDHFRGTNASPLFGFIGMTS